MCLIVFILWFFIFLCFCFIFNDYMIVIYGFLLLIFFEVKLGLLEVEFEDILLCDDDVLNDVYMYWMFFICWLLLLFLV